MTKKQHCLALASTAFPLALWLLLGLLNPRFANRMLVHSPAQPAGWIMAAAIFVLISTAYFIQRKRFELLHQSNETNGTLSRTPLQNVAVVGSIMLLVLSATSLVLFGPAIVTVLNATF